MLVPVETGSGRYDVRIKAGTLLQAAVYIHEAVGDRRLFVIADEAVWEAQGHYLTSGLADADWSVLALPLGEPRKCLDTVEQLCQAMHVAEADRRTVVVAFGGGVAGDICGFVAAAYMRGVDAVQIPTTLLAQVDASVGGKTGVNLATGKNMVGAFHQPKLVLIDPDVLETLPDREYRAGVQEVVKHGIIRSAELFEFMEKERDAVLARDGKAVEYMIEMSVRIKADVVRSDEREGGLRRILNFGHTLGHALEAETDYSLLLHGEAVAFGMIAAARLSELRGCLAARDRKRIQAAVLSYCDLPDLSDLDPVSIVSRVAGDKKAVGGQARFVLADGIGSVRDEVAPPLEEVIAATKHALRVCRTKVASAV